MSTSTTASAEDNEQRATRSRPPLGTNKWTDLQRRHLDRLKPLIGPYLTGRSRGLKDPILDFLFEYYAFRPGHLLKWSPGIGRILEGNPANLEVGSEYLKRDGDAFFVDPQTFPERRLRGLHWIVTLLRSTSQKKPMIGCHGLHEWAMVYKVDDIRHPQFPLRLGRQGTDAVVESQALVCTHFDAFRFFTEPAIPRNNNQLSREGCVSTEQPGCLHVNMDLYKWTYKLYPWTSGELLADAFLLARDIRMLDMKASPYDLSEIGLEPVKIETAEGRLHYREMQQQFYERAKIVRSRLLSTAEMLLDATTKVI